MTIGRFMCNWALGLLLGLTLVPASAATIEACVEAAGVAKRILPYRKDRFTVVTDVTCAPGNSKPTFTYVAQVSAEPSLVSQIKFGDIKREALTEFCTSPPMKALLGAFDVRHTYRFPDGTEAGSFLMQASECSPGAKQSTDLLELYRQSLESKPRYVGEPWRQCAVAIEEGLKSACFVLDGKPCSVDTFATELLESRRTTFGTKHLLLTTVNGVDRRQNQCEVAKTGSIVKITEVR